MNKFNRFAIVIFCCLTTAYAYADLPFLQQGYNWRYSQIELRPDRTHGTPSTREFRILYKTIKGEWVVGVRDVPVPTANVTPQGKETLWKIINTLRTNECLIDISGGNSLAGPRGCEEIREGESWSLRWNGINEAEESTIRFLGRDAIKVPAGTFETLKFVEERTSQPASNPADAHKFRTTFWYAPTVRGMVRVEREFLDQHESITKTLLEELISFKEK